MKKIYLLLLLLMSFWGVGAQVGYVFSHEIGLFQENSTAATTLTSVQADSAISLPISLGFPFNYAGVNYTQFKMSSNGFISFNMEADFLTTNSFVTANLSSRPIIAPLWDDMDGNAIGGSRASYELTGAAPNRVMTIEWKNWQWFYNSVNPVISFQIKLYETTNVIEFIYRHESGSVTSLASASIGIGGSTVANGYLNVINVTAPAVSSTSHVTNISSKPANNQVFRFTPPPPCNDMPVGGTVSVQSQMICSGSTPAIINVTGYTSVTTVSNITYQWEESDDNGVADEWTNVTGGLGATTTSYTPPAFDGTTKYYRLKVTCTTTNQSAYSDASVVNNMTPPVTAAQAITFTEVTSTTMKINWTNGSGNRRYVVINTTNAFTDPVSGTGPAISGVNTSYSGTGEQIVYNGTGSAVTVTNLVCNTTYYVRVYEYNRCGSAAPFTYYYNITNSTTNPASQLSNYSIVSMPQAINFTGFNGSNLTTLFPNWAEGSGAVKPESTTSLWSESTLLGVPTAKINLFSNNRQEWILSNKITINTASRINFKAAISAYNAGTAHDDGMQGTDDKVQVMISADGCGNTWTPLYTFNASNTANLTNILTDYTVEIPVQYIGQDVMIAFFASDGPVNDDPDYDFHITNILVENIPNCELPTNVVISEVTKNSAVISWEASSSASILGYTYEIRTAGTPGSSDQGLVSSGTLGDVLTYTPTGLLPATTYNVYVRTQCQSTVFSGWTSVKTFTTLCYYPDLQNITPATICGIGTANLFANVNEGIIRWYANPTGGAPLATGTNFFTPEINATTSYYVSSGIANDDLDIPVGAGTATLNSYANPFYSLWSNSHTQYMIKAEELLAAGIVAGNINSVALDVTNAGTLPMVDFSLKIGTTTETAMTDFIANTNFSIVNTTASLMPETGLNVLNFSQPFVWDGVSNIILEFCHGNATSSATMSRIVKGDPTSFVSVIKTHASASVSSSIICGDTTTNKETYSVRPKFIFNAKGICSSPRVEVIATVTAAPEFTLSASTLEICEGSSSELVTITEGAENYEAYTWEPSTGVTGDALTGWVFNPTETTVYKLIAVQNEGAMCREVKNMNVEVNPLPVFTPLEEQYIVCKDEIFELSFREFSVTDFIVGTDTTIGGDFDVNTAFMNRWTFSKQQYIYTKEELNALGFFGGNITGLSFNITSLGSAATNQEYTIKIKGVENNLITSTTFITEGLTTVYGPVTHTHTDSGWQDIMFSTIYNWDGESNLLIEIYQKGANSSNNSKTYYSTLTGNVGLSQQSGSNAATGTLTNKRLNTKFFIEKVDVTWSPETRLYTDAEATVAYVSGEHAPKVYFKRNANEELEFNYTATLTSVFGCEATQDITINVVDVMIPQVENQIFCDAVSINDIVLIADEDSNIHWYASATSNEVLTTISTTGTYYVEAEQLGCKTERVAVEITIVGAQSPTVAPTQYFCDSASVSDLMITVNQGFEARWYATVDATTALSMNTSLTNNTTYYASMIHTLSGCESARIPVVVLVTPTPEAIPSQAISLCQSTHFGDLELSALPNATLKWFVSMTATQPIHSLLPVTNGTYYVSQTVNGCESVRSQIQIDVYAGLEKPAANTQNVCGSGTVADLVATGAVSGAVYNWYATASSTTPLTLTTILTSGVYYVSQSIAGCESPRRSVTVRIIPQTAPIVNAFVLCGSGTIADLHLPTASFVSYKWYATATSAVELAQNVALSTGTYYVARVEHGCVSQRTAVAVTIADIPSSPTGATSQNFTVNTIGEATLADLVMDQTNIVWYITAQDAKNANNPLPSQTPLVSGQTYYAVVIGTNGCPSMATAVTVEITLGVDDFDKTSLVYYPNPTSDVLNIRYKNTIDQLVVYNLLGQRVITQRYNSDEIQLDMSALPSGNYLIELHSENHIQIIKVVVK